MYAEPASAGLEHMMSVLWVVEALNGILLQHYNEKFKKEAKMSFRFEDLKVAISKTSHVKGSQGE